MRSTSALITRKRLYLLCGVLAVLLVALDQISKQWAVATLMGERDIILIPGVLQLHYLENLGAAFSIFSGNMIFFYILTPIISIGILWLFLRLPVEQKFTPVFICITFLFAGAIGNYIDRIVNHFVVDFIYVSLIHFPVFNVADIYVTGSMGVLLILFVFHYKDDDLNRIFQ